jgi:hypothetical protein
MIMLLVRNDNNNKDNGRWKLTHSSGSLQTDNYRWMMKKL